VKWKKKCGMGINLVSFETSIEVLLCVRLEALQEVVRRLHVDSARSSHMLVVERQHYWERIQFHQLGCCMNHYARLMLAWRCSGYILHSQLPVRREHHRNLLLM